MEYDKKKIIPVNLIYWKCRPFSSYFCLFSKQLRDVNQLYFQMGVESNYAINWFFLYIKIQRQAN